MPLRFGDVSLTFADFQYAEVRTRVASGDLWQRSATQNSRGLSVFQWSGDWLARMRGGGCSGRVQPS